MSWVRLPASISYVHDTQKRNNNLWIAQKIASCGNRTGYTFRVSRRRRRRATAPTVQFFKTLYNIHLYIIDQRYPCIQVGSSVVFLEVLRDDWFWLMESCKYFKTSHYSTGNS